MDFVLRLEPVSGSGPVVDTKWISGTCLLSCRGAVLEAEDSSPGSVHTSRMSISVSECETLVGECVLPCTHLLPNPARPVRGSTYLVDRNSMYLGAKRDGWRGVARPAGLLAWYALRDSLQRSCPGGHASADAIPFGTRSITSAHWSAWRRSLGFLVVRPRRCSRRKDSLCEVTAAPPAKPEPTVTIGLPVFNGEPFIAEAIRSIQAQTFSSFILLISDNASSDSTAQICEEFARLDERVEYHRQDQNVGAVANYNYVLGEARTPYFKWAAADDVLDPTFLDRCVSTLEEDRGLISCCSKVARIDEESLWPGCESDNLRRSALDASTRFVDTICKPHSCFSLSGVYRTDVLRRTLLLGNHVGADRTLLAELALHGPSFELDRYLLFRRIHPASFSSGRTLSFKEHTRWWAADSDLQSNGHLDFSRGRAEVYRELIRRSPLDARETRACMRKIDHRYRFLVARRWVARRTSWPIKRGIRRALDGRGPSS